MLFRRGLGLKAVLKGLGFECCPERVESCPEGV